MGFWDKVKDRARAVVEPNRYNATVEVFNDPHVEKLRRDYRVMEPTSSDPEYARRFKGEFRNDMARVHPEILDYEHYPSTDQHVNFRQAGPITPAGTGGAPPMCTVCGGVADHRHGKHGCCGRQGCHMKLYLNHWTYGENGVNSYMRKNWLHI